jgi:hypothetical protein
MSELLAAATIALTACRPERPGRRTAAVEIAPAPDETSVDPLR